SWLERSFPDAETAAAALQRQGILASKVYNPAELLEHPHFVRRRMIVDVDHPLVGALPIVATPIKFSATPTVTGRAPLLGEHNEEALRRWLGYEVSQVSDLYESGVLEQDTLVAALRQAGDLQDPG